MTDRLAPSQAMIGDTLVHADIVRALHTLWEGDLTPDGLPRIELGIRALLCGRRLFASQVDRDRRYGSWDNTILGPTEHYRPPFRDGLLEYEFTHPEVPVELLKIDERESSFLMDTILDDLKTIGAALLLLDGKNEAIDTMEKADAYLRSAYDERDYLKGWDDRWSDPGDLSRNGVSGNPGAVQHRFRRAMVRPGRERLTGKVEVDESYVGMRDSSKLLAGTKLKSHTSRSLVAIAVEMQEPKGFGRIRLRRVPVDSERYLLPFVRDAVEPGTRVHTDGSPAYRSLSEHGYVHQRSVHLGSGGPAHVSMPGVHRLASLLKRWLLGTHQGAVQPSQLDYYLDEFTFRFNRRTSRSRGLLFYRLLEQALVTQPVTYQRIVAHRG